MPTNLDDAIRKKLVSYLAGRMSLKAFGRWFVPATFDIEDWASASLKELAYEISLRLAEYSNGHWTEKELRQKLLPLATCVNIEEASAPKIVTRTSRAFNKIIPFPAASSIREVSLLKSGASGDSPASVCM